MKSSRVELWLCFALFAGLTLSSVAASPDLQLGDPPPRPADISGFPIEMRSALATSGFTVNTTNREEVRSFYNAIYPASEGVPMNSTANAASCFAGTNGADFDDAVLRRINWFRAMAGIPANVTFNAINNSNAQVGAVMMSASTITAGTNLSHMPTNGGVWQCWSITGSNACRNSNLALGASGPDAITGYIEDPGSGNSAVGHRRWLLYPQTQVMGSGDVPFQGNLYSANATWVFDSHLNDPRPATRAPYVAWPPAGYVPAPVVYSRWSFAVADANLTNATITMTSNGVPVSVSKELIQGGYGENTLVWVPMGLDATNPQMDWPFNGSDTVYTVAIGNVSVGGNVSNYNYSVTVFDPNVPGAGYFPPVIAGTNQPVPGIASAYSFSAVSNATGYQWRYTQRNPFSFFDGAEGTLANWITNTESDYSVISTSPVASGTHAFQLVHSQGKPQAMTLNYTLWPAANMFLQFKSQLEYALITEIARVQASTNDGASWFDVYTQAGTNTPSIQGPGENAFSTKTVSLGAYAGNRLQLRFLYDVVAPYYYYAGPASIVGWHLDDIGITNTEQLLTPVTNSIAGTNFQFTPAQAGNYNLEARGVIFTDFPLGWGPAKQVTAVNDATVIVINGFSVGGNQAKVDFTLQSGSVPSFKLLTAPQPGGIWSTDTVAILTTNAPGSFRFTTTPSGNARFYKVKAP